MSAQVRSDKRRCGVWRLGVWVLLALPALVQTGCEDQIEQMLGANTAAAIERTYPVNQDALLGEWNRGTGETLTAFGTRQQIPYTFKVLNTDMVNAFAAPWGYVYVTQGLLDFVDTEDEAITVIGHEVGHVANRDSINSFKQSLLFSLAAGLIGQQSQTWGDLASVGLGLLSLSYSRTDEFEADDSGALLAYRSGYNPGGMTDFLGKLHQEVEKGKSESWLESLFSTHPFTPDRIDRQREKPWVLAQTTPSAVRVAQGYLRRGEFAPALDLLKTASSAAPGDPQVTLLTADALFGRGAIEEARQGYQTASTQTTSPYPQQALAMVAAFSAVAPSPPSAEEQSRAQTLLAEAGTVSAQANGARTMVDNAARDREPGLAAARKLYGAGMGLLQSLSQQEMELPQASEQAVLRANSAVTEAADLVYSLDRFQQFSRTGAQWGTGAARMARATLGPLSQGQGQSGRLELIRTALTEIAKIDDDLAAAGASADAAVVPGQEAQKLGMQAAVVVDQIFRKGHDDEHLLFLVRDLTNQTRAATAAAQEQTRKAKHFSDRAMLRGMIAALQLTHAQARAEELPGLDRLVAHYLQTTPGTVASLRARGLGYGDLAVALATAANTGRPVEQVAVLPGQGASFLDRAGLNRDQVSGLKVLLKFLTRAMLLEVEPEGPEQLPLPT